MGERVGHVHEPATVPPACCLGVCFAGHAAAGSKAPFGTRSLTDDLKSRVKSQERL